MENYKLIHQLFIGKVADIIGMKKTIELLKESNDSINTVVVKKTKTLEERHDTFLSKLSDYVGEYPHNMVDEFRAYWSEHNDNGKKMRFEMSKNQPFNIKRRLATWKKNNKNWNNNQPLTASEKLNKALGL